MLLGYVHPHVDTKTERVELSISMTIFVDMFHAGSHLFL